MSKEEIVSAIQNCARKLGRVPTRRELQKMNGVSHREVDRRFGSYGRAVTLAGLEPERKQKYGIGREALLMDWARVARKLGKAPTRFEYIAEGAYSTTPFERHWKRWSQVQADFMKFAKEAGQEGRWEEVVEIAGKQKLVGRELTRTSTNEFLAHSGGRALPQIGADETDRAIVEIAKIAEIEEKTSPLIKADLTDRKNIRMEKQVSPQMSTENADQKRAGTDGSPTSPSSSAIEESSFGCASGFRQRAQTPAERLNLPLMNTDPRQAGTGDTDQKRTAEKDRWWRKRRVLRDRPVYGAPAVHAGALGHLPVNEAGVLVAFGMLAERLGLVVLRVQTEFPDCEVLCEMEPGRWQRLRVEFEFESRNFLRHGHDPNGCDMIVCWRHNWAECPEGIEVVELSGIIG